MHCILKFAGAAIVLSLLGGCVTLSPGGRGVKIMKSVPHQDCEELGIIYGSGGGGGYTNAKTKLESAQNDLRNQAFDRGGNILVMDAASGDVQGMAISGRAFRCRKHRKRPKPVRPLAEHPLEGQPDAVAPDPVFVPAPAGNVEGRLATLKEWLGKGVITQDEHDRRRAEIIGSL
jgi:hypothetical protein